MADTSDPKPSDSEVNIGINPGTHEHSIIVEGQETTHVPNPENYPRSTPVHERRRYAAPVNVAVGGAATALPGIWGIVGNLSATTFVMGMFYILFMQYANTLKQQLDRQVQQTDARDALYREALQAQQQLEMRRYEALQMKIDAFLTHQQSSIAEVRTSRTALEEAVKRIQTLER